ncbi:ATP-binding protein [Streptomyces albipurpureus]|uniref:AAA family ATPase n=1 Tax=Streptomyces albipurpureus TaxID=2897419 RepID=A0ABT0UK22_9ACTN|nr:AAA family ATPase [Streptomyces sp. CWNU-1]MCM2388962.1 AAA family ATPase [Streptomyces sp. CWNU-1]
MTPALIGRDHPAGVLRTEIGRATESHGGLVLVTGEAGIGKTSLVTDAADEARRRGALVLGGSCWDSDSAPGYWPWVQVVRALRRSAGDDWPQLEKAAGGRLGALLGEELGESREGGESFALYDAVTTALVTFSQQRPLVVVLDDLHWADSASLKLLEFAAQHAWFERLLLVGTYRDVEVEAADHPLRHLILPLTARAAATVTLTGLGRDEVGALIALTAGVEPEPAMVDEVFRRTGGNPFFVEQTARIWRSGSPVTTVAPGVREAVRRRLALLPDSVSSLLETAAVLGREFHRQVLAAAVSAPVPQVDRLLERAVASRLVTPRAGGRFAFAHDLVRETLYDELAEAETRSRHAAVVRALDAAPVLNDKMVPADLARHAYLAGEELDREKRVELLLVAARNASGRLAREEAMGHFRRAIEAAGDDTRKAALIHLELGGECGHHGDAEDSQRAFEQAVALAKPLRDPELLARVAITLHQNDYFTTRKAENTQLLRDAHRALIGSGDEPALPPELLAQELAVQTTALARSGDDDDALAFSLWARHDAIWGLGTSEERLTLTDEMIEVGHRTENREMELHAQSMRWVTLLELADPRYLDQLRTFSSVAERAGLRRFELAHVIDNALIAGLCGRFAQAREGMARLAQLQEAHGPFDFMQAHLEWALDLLQGRFDAAQAVVDRLDTTGHPYPELLVGLTAAERGNTALAVRMADAVQDLPEPLPRMFTPLWMRLRAQAAVLTGDRERIAEARAALAPYRGQWLVSLYGCDLGGPVDLWLGLLDEALGDRDAAEAELTAAYESADRMWARPWSVRSRAALIRVLGAMAPAELMGLTHRDAAELGLTHLIAPSEPGPIREPIEPAQPAPDQEFRRDGAVWSLTFAGREVHMPEAKGLRDLHALLSHSGEDVPAVALLDPAGGATVLAAHRFGADPVLDEEAKSRYRLRLERLDEEIDRAAELGDTHRAAEFDRERVALLDELRTAAGLGGRTRRLGDEAERARKTVTARIRDTLRKLDALHPELAAHLRESVTTGAHCAYRPVAPVEWRL